MIDTKTKQFLMKIQPTKKRLEVYEFIKKMEKKAKNGGKNGHS